MQVKICGITAQKQLNELSKMDVDMIGLNFYPKSKRYVDRLLQMDQCDQQKVGVFVNASIADLREKTNMYQLDLLQLHGDESIEYCRQAQEIAPIIKVWRVGSNFDFDQLANFEFCDYFLFDTYTPAYGGSGKAFDWQVLADYRGETPFYLSGGIGPDSIHALRQVDHPQLAGVDINSKFEESPGVKDLVSVTTFINELKK